MYTDTAKRIQNRRGVINTLGWVQFRLT